MSEFLVLFMKGDTEVEFNKQVVANAGKLHPAGRFDTNIEYRNVRGVGGFKGIASENLLKKDEMNGNMFMGLIFSLFYYLNTNAQ